MPAQAMLNRYVSDAVSTVPPARLVTMLYDALVRDLVQAEQAVQAGNVELANDKLVHAQAIVLELQSGLDPAKWSGAVQLDQLYVFWVNELMAANVAKDATRVAAVRRLVEPLQEAWHIAAAEVGAGG